MLYKILEKFSKLKSSSQASFDKTSKEIENYDKEIIKNFLELYDKQVKTIHSNEERIEKNLQLLYTESLNLQKNTKEACKIYDDLLEYFKEAGDLYNWCTILEQEMNSLENIFIPGKNIEPKKELEKEQVKEKEKNDEKNKNEENKKEENKNEENQKEENQKEENKKEEKKKEEKK